MIIPSNIERRETEKFLLICLEDIVMLGRLFNDYSKSQYRKKKLLSKNLPPLLLLPKCHKAMLFLDITETRLTHNMPC
jgi:hypothetical protein